MGDLGEGFPDGRRKLGRGSAAELDGVEAEKSEGGSGRKRYDPGSIEQNLGFGSITEERGHAVVGRGAGLDTRQRFWSRRARQMRKFRRHDRSIGTPGEWVEQSGGRSVIRRDEELRRRSTGYGREGTRMALWKTALTQG